jgi:hypothetical protein
MLGNREQSEQIPGGPAESLSLLAPGGEEAPSVLDALLPTGNKDMSGAARFESGECTT